MSLFNTSMFSNFLAEKFDFNPQDLCWDAALDQDAENFIRLNLSSGIDTLWLFGIQHLLTLPENIAQRFFVFQKKNTLDQIDSTPLIADNWAFTSESLYQQSKNKHINFCIHWSFIANLNDPRPLLLAIKKIGLSNNRMRAIIIKDQNFDKFIARTWSDNSLSEFLSSAGFIVRSEHDARLNRTYFVIELTTEHYQKYLVSKGLSLLTLSTRQLVISTEDSSIEPSGGIGTYVKNLKTLSTETVFLYCNTKALPLLRRNNTLLLSELIGIFYSEKSSDTLDMVEAVKVILFMLPDLSICEFQDHLALGFRIVQAKHTGQLPQNLHLRTFLHGNIDHIKFAEQQLPSAAYGLNEIKTIIKDSFVFKYSDSCRIPSTYLQNVMSDEFGYRLNHPHLLQLPFDLTSLPQRNTHSLSEVKKIIFIGKYSFQKGWPDFIALIKELHLKNLLLDINEIISLAPGSPDKEQVAQISSLCAFSFKHVEHDALLQFIADFRHESLFVLPSRGENFPYAVLELLLSGARFVTYKSGGSPEIICSDQFEHLFFTDVSVAQLFTGVSAILQMDIAHCEQHIESETARVLERQIATNLRYSAPLNSSVNSNSFNIPEALNFSVTITTPIFSTPLKFLKELLQSICNSSMTPFEWILINDGSSPEYSERLVEFVSQNQNKLPIRLITQRNQGLSSARNAGLRASNTKYTLFIDSDDLLLPHTISQNLVALLCSPQLVAVSGVSLYFTDAESMPKNMGPLKNHGYWSPLGVPEAKTLSLLENQYIPSCMLSDTEKIRASGGWDATDKSTWEDWAFCSHLAWNNLRFSLIPNAGFLYRDTPGSMSKTYNQYLGRRRLIRNVPGLSRQDVSILTAMAMAADPRGADGQHRLEVLLKNTLNSTSWKITAPLRNASHQARLFKKWVSESLARLFKAESR